MVLSTTTAHRASRRRRSPFPSMQPQTRRATLYARYSSEMQAESWSIDAQLADLRRYCEVHGWQIVAEHVDAARSGKNDQRPEFQRALETVRSGQASVIVVHKLDRFSRSMEDTFRLVNEFEVLGAGLVCTQQGIDTTNPITGKIVLAVLAALAETYLDNLSEETSKGKRARALAGLPNGDVPYGYANPDRGTERSGAGLTNTTAPVIVPEQASVVRQAFEWYATGQYSHARLAQTLNAAGHRMVSKRHPDGYPWTKDTITALLKNPFYAGIVTLYGEEVRDAEGRPVARHEPIIDRALFEQVQAIHAAKGHQGRRGSTADTRIYVAAGLVHCRCCKQPLRVETQAGHRIMYRDKSPDRGIPCTAIRRSVEGEMVDAALERFICHLHLPSTWREVILAEVDDGGQQVRQMAERRAALDGQLAQAQRYLLDGYITAEQFREKRAAIEAERATLVPPSSLLDMDLAEALAHDMARVWSGAEPDERRTWARALFDAVWVDLDARVVVAVQMKSTLRALRSVLLYDAGPDSEATIGRMRTRRDSNPRSPA